MAEQQQTQPQQKPYMAFNPGPISQHSSVPGIDFDFNLGVRVTVPKGDYRVKFIDNDAHMTIYDAPASGVICSSTKRYYVNFRIEVYKKKKVTEELIFAHDYNCAKKNVVMKFPDGALGDVLAWFPYAEEFRKKHHCTLFCAMPQRMIDILEPGYPEIHFVGMEERPVNVYATYYVGLFYPWDGRELQPVDWRVVGLAQHAAYLLGVPAKEERVHLTPAKESPIKEPYVCIATQATAQCKYWNNIGGWVTVVENLKKKGYRVLCIDQYKVTSCGIWGNALPYGCEDFTGSKPLQERIDLLAHAAFFIGLPSGLSWLAYGSGVPIVLIAGFTAPGTEFTTPYRVQQYHTCNSCWNDQRTNYDNKDYEWCPHHEHSNEAYICTQNITPKAVMNTVDRLMKDYKLSPKQ